MIKRFNSMYLTMVSEGIQKHRKTQLVERSKFVKFGVFIKNHYFFIASKTRLSVRSPTGALISPDFRENEKSCFSVSRLVSIGLQNAERTPAQPWQVWVKIYFPPLLKIDPTFFQTQYFLLKFSGSSDLKVKRTNPGSFRSKISGRGAR